MVYISLGSNMGDRNAYLQLAVGLIAYRVGEIKQISPIYETPSWGFQSDDFLNCCLEIETRLPPKELLNALLEIEAFLGRKRKTSRTYLPRTIDLDILYYGDRVMASNQLTLPHPKIEMRKFILAPLGDIAPHFRPPIGRRTVGELLKNCSDTTALKVIDTTLSRTSIANFIAIEGNIGTGKTALAHRLAKAFGGELLLENFYDNPYLEKFYQNPDKYALAVETAFLEERLSHYTSFFSSKHKLPVIADYCLEKSLLFAQQNLNGKTLATYEEKYSQTTTGLPQPEVVIYLDQKIENAYDQIQKRGRSFEKNIDLNYLRKIDAGYHKWLKTKPLPVCQLNVKSLDFVANETDFFQVLLAFFKH